MFIPLLGFTDTDCTGRTDVVFFLHENPQFVSVKGTTKKADAFGLFVYPNSKSVLHATWNVPSFIIVKDAFSVLPEG